ncbi:MAG: 23S rRNA (guanine(2445)-N(2))-methyltransferase [Firmicutes bacterium]|nr:23S rRNA (guanine(2445)-N(2))-methyltransferase [Bacillota bacterium]MDI6706188.1 class I SAM-dependent RNA methyltransferase [Bacillota bacterium]
MENIELIATSTFGLEALVKRELLNLGYSDLSVENGKVTFKADISAIPTANLWLRTADRVLLKMGEFTSLSFEELFENTKSLPWDEWITEDGKFTVIGKSVKSKLHSVPNCQAIVKKAVVERMKQKYKTDWFNETGPEYTIQVSILKDIATLTIDTSGTGLHKRGYREGAVEAPLKETLAAALVQLSFWNKERVLLDPFCGSGTIPIEAAMIGRNIAPGLNRTFASEEWPVIGRDAWKKARVAAYKSIDLETDLHIFGSDIDSRAVQTAQNNAARCGVDDCIIFETKPVSRVELASDYGIAICNPPYGERLGEKSEAESIYKALGELFSNRQTWSVYVLTSNEDFEEFYGRTADRKRKLYNGRIKVDYYQFYGEKPLHE